MSEPFMGEVRIFAGNFAPLHWAACNGQLLAIAQNSALFSLLGTTYGGDGRTSFGLPGMRGRVAVGQGNGPGLTPRVLGQRFGTQTVTLTGTQIPNHTHYFQATKATSNSPAPGGRLFGEEDAVDIFAVYDQDPSNLRNLSSQVIQATGGGQAHSNMMAFQCLLYIIALQGLYPPRN